MIQGPARPGLSASGAIVLRGGPVGVQRGLILIRLVGVPKTQVEAETTSVEPVEPDWGHPRVGNNVIVIGAGSRAESVYGHWLPAGIFSLHGDSLGQPYIRRQRRPSQPHSPVQRSQRQPAPLESVVGDFSFVFF